MKDKFFLDTNIFVYSFDKKSKLKCTRSKELITEALTGSHGAISFQVIQEFLNVATRKFATPLSTLEAREYLQKVLKPLCELNSSVLLYTSALSIQGEYKSSFYDSLIIASALLTGCTLLYSEDFQHNQTIRDLRIVNPFL